MFNGTWSDVMPLSNALYKLSFVIAQAIRFGSWYSILEKCSSNYLDLKDFKTQKSRVSGRCSRASTSQTDVKFHTVT